MLSLVVGCQGLRGGGGGPEEGWGAERRYFAGGWMINLPKCLGLPELGLVEQVVVIEYRSTHNVGGLQNRSPICGLPLAQDRFDALGQFPARGQALRVRFEPAVERQRGAAN